MEYGAKIILYRALFIKKIQEIAKSIHFNITQGAEQLDVQYLPNVEIGETNQLAEIKKLFEKILNANKRKEVDTGITLTGPHRDDVDFIVNNISVKNFGSQGQQRTAVLSLKMAEMEFMKEDLGEYPVLLLDDIMSELDHQRQEYILRSMENKQVMITCTDIDRFIMDRDISFFKIEKGTVLKGGH